MASPLNVFKSVPAVITTTPEDIYTTPFGTTTIVLMAQVANVGTETCAVTAWHVDSTANTELVKDLDIPTKDSAGLLTGKLVLEQGSKFRIAAEFNSNLKIVLSLLETLNG